MTRTPFCLISPRLFYITNIFYVSCPFMTRAMKTLHSFLSHFAMFLCVPFISQRLSFTCHVPSGRERSRLSSASYPILPCFSASLLYNEYLLRDMFLLDAGSPQLSILCSIKQCLFRSYPFLFKF